MRIALINPPWMYKRLYTHGIYPPYGILMVGTVLQRAGHEVRIIDANAHDLDDAAVHAELARFDPHALGITVFTDSFDYIARTGPWWHQAFPGRPLVIGGPLVSGAPGPCLAASGADVATLGEAFESAPLLFAALERGDPLDAIPGLAIARPGQPIVRTGPTPTSASLDALPLPDWELLDVERYLASNDDPYFRDRRLQRYLSIITTLGCPWRCTFCQVPTLFEGVRKRSPASVAAEVAGYRERYGIESMYFRDDILFRPEQIGAALQAQVPGMRWSCLLRADMMTDDRVGRMRDGGCAEIRVGFESGDDLVLATANKKTEVSDNVRCIEVCRRQGVQLSGFLIVGLPGETEQSLRATERFVADNGVRVSVHFPLPLPGTVLFDQGRRDGLIPDEAALLRNFSLPQLPGMVLQAPPVNYTDLSNETLVAWAMRIAEAGRTDQTETLATVSPHADAPF
ncbi:MAG: radical SAM protein [Myxococcales bacterium]|nr:radical SAM protein [Myxococcales bacterium]